MVRPSVNNGAQSEGEWGTVCDDDFTQTSAQAACKTLGFTGGSFSFREDVTGDRHDNDPMKIWMDNVRCESSTTRFYWCSHEGWGSLRGCGHWEDVVLYCS